MVETKWTRPDWRENGNGKWEMENAEAKDASPGKKLR